MWVLVMFDLPMKTKADRRRYTQFRNFLLQNGYSMLQFSLYARAAGSHEQALRLCADLKWSLPEKGEVRVLKVTAVQFARMERFVQGVPAEIEKPPEQLSLF
jgi:CRISPR-associated protein Cas2